MVNSIVFPFLAFLAVGAFFLVSQGFRPLRSQSAEIAKHDRNLIAFASSLEGLDIEQQRFISAIGQQLTAYSIGASNNLIYYQVLGVITVSASFIAVGITGTSYLECTSAKSLSFSVNLVAALVTGLSQFFLFDKNAQSAAMAAGKLRLELLQFIGRSDGYMGLGINDRYDLFAKSADTLLTDNLKNSGGASFDAKKDLEKAKESAHNVRD
jgi:hypothetical protein